MAKIIAVLTLVLLFGVSICLGRQQTHESKLIQVKPAYSAATPQPQPGQIDPYAAVPPRPRDQLYVFWILGKLISYPFDKADSYIHKIRSGWKREGTPTPACAPADSNPFKSVNWSQIPPAHPISDPSSDR
jgi:hypothetical protein